MRLAGVAAWSALATIVLYALWIIAAADDYDGGFKHVAAITSGVLCLAALATFVGSLALLISRRFERRR